MTLDTVRFREILSAVHPEAVSPAHADAIIELVQLTLDSDGREDVDEIQAFFALGKAVYAIANSAKAATRSGSRSANSSAIDEPMQFPIKIGLEISNLSSWSFNPCT